MSSVDLPADEATRHSAAVPPRYAPARSLGPAPSGWMFIANHEDADGGKPLLVTHRTGQALIAWSKQVWEARNRVTPDPHGQDASGSSRVPPSGAPKAHPHVGRDGLKPRPSFQIPIPVADVLDPPEPVAGGPWVRVWDSANLLSIILRHNAGDGSADRADRERNAATWQAQIDAGPWRPCPVPSDPAAAVAALRAELGHLPTLCDLIEDRVAMAQAQRSPFSLPPTLLIGPPGVGKSHAARRVAELLELPVAQLDMSCQQTNSTLHGADKHWSNAAPGLLRQLVVGGKVANPVVVLDELDKAPRSGSGRHYDPMAPLHAALEPVTSRVTEDRCIPGEFDASRVIFIATANSLATIPDSLLSRFVLVPCHAPGARQALAVAQRIAHELTSGLAGFAPASRSIIAALADRTPRQMRQMLEAAIARAVRSGRRYLHQRDLGAQEQRPTQLH